MEGENKSQKFSEFAGATTLHGLNKTCDTSSHLARRLAWLFLLLVMIGLYLYISISSFISYYQYESVTKLTKTARTELEFPSVSICFQNLFPRSLVEHRPELEYWMRYLETHHFSSLPEEMRENATSILQTQPLVNALLPNTMDLLERCEFNLEEFECEDLFVTQTSESSQCVTFMHEEHRERYGPKITSTPGYLYGLNVWINIDFDDYLETSTFGAGIKVNVHHYESHPRINEKGLAISPGSEAYLAIKEHRIKNLPAPHSRVDCVKDEGQYKPKYGQLAVRTSYNFESCVLDCMLELGFGACSCSFDTPPFCTLVDYYSCIQFKINTYFPKCDCLYPCKYTDFDTKLSTLALPTPTYMNYAAEQNFTHTTVDSIRQNVINLKVFYPDLQLTTIAQYPAYTAYELISNLGGQLGLFLGASLISMGELLEFLLLTCFYRCKRLVNRKNPSVQAWNETGKDLPAFQRETIS